MSKMVALLNRQNHRMTRGFGHSDTMVFVAILAILLAIIIPNLLMTKEEADAFRATEEATDCARAMIAASESGSKGSCPATGTLYVITETEEGKTLSCPDAHKHFGTEPGFMKSAEGMVYRQSYQKPLTSEDAEIELNDHTTLIKQDDIITIRVNPLPEDETYAYFLTIVAVIFFFISVYLVKKDGDFGCFYCVLFIAIPFLLLVTYPRVNTYTYIFSGKDRSVVCTEEDWSLVPKTEEHITDLVALIPLKVKNDCYRLCAFYRTAEERQRQVPPGGYSVLKIEIPEASLGALVPLDRLLWEKVAPASP